MLRATRQVGRGLRGAAASALLESSGLCGPGGRWRSCSARTGSRQRPSRSWNVGRAFSETVPWPHPRRPGPGWGRGASLMPWRCCGGPPGLAWERLFCNIIWTGFSLTIACWSWPFGTRSRASRRPEATRANGARSAGANRHAGVPPRATPASGSDGSHGWATQGWAAAPA